jgi:hypothetical protein
MVLAVAPAWAVKALVRLFAASYTQFRPTRKTRLPPVALSIKPLFSSSTVLAGGFPHFG